MQDKEHEFLKEKTSYLIFFLNLIFVLLKVLLHLKYTSLYSHLYILIVKAIQGVIFHMLKLSLAPSLWANKTEWKQAVSARKCFKSSMQLEKQI